MASDDVSTDEFAAEKLGEVLQNMQRMIDQLPGVHTSSASKTEDQNVCSVGRCEKFSQLCQSRIQDVGDKPIQTRSWTSRHLSSVLEEGKTDPQEQENLTACINLSQEYMAKQLSNFIEDMRKTIEVWQGRYWSLIKGHGNSRVEKVRTNREIDQLDFGLDSEKAISVAGTLKLLQPSGDSQQHCKATGTHENEHNHYHMKMATAFPVQNQSTQNSSVYKYGVASIHNREDDPVLPSILKLDLSSKMSKKPQKKTSLVNSQDVTVRKLEYKVEVVEGWITEVKTRTSGGSAGCKDKYYYDPVSKRRCRSRKEVFSLIETGKLGRYKRRLKFPLTKSQSVGECPSTEQATIVNEHHTHLKIKNKRGFRNKLVTAVASTSLPCQQNPSGNSATAVGISPFLGQHGIVSNMFFSYLPGQP